MDTNRSNAKSYIFLQLGEEVKKIERLTGQKVLNFGIGSPDFPASAEYIDRFQSLTANRSLYKYPGYGASEAFREAVIKWYANRHAVDISNLAVLPLPGVKYGISHLPLALYSRDDEVFIPDPGYPAYRDTLQLSGAKAVPYDLLENHGFKPDIGELEKKCTEHTRFIWLNFPANPTGQTLSVDELSSLAMFARSHNLTMLFDNAYSELVFEGQNAPSIFNVPGTDAAALEFGSFSKSYSMAGLRLGWVVGPKELVGQLQDLFSLYDSGVSLLLQEFGAFILTNPDAPWHSQMLAHYEEKRRTIASFLQSLGLTFELPPGSLYIWARIPAKFNDSSQYSRQLLHDRHILVTPGSAFGSNGLHFVRVSIGADIQKLDDYR